MQVQGQRERAADQAVERDVRAQVLLQAAQRFQRDREAPLARDRRPAGRKGTGPAPAGASPPPAAPARSTSVRSPASRLPFAGRTSRAGRRGGTVPRPSSAPGPPGPRTARYSRGLAADELGAVAADKRQPGGTRRGFVAEGPEEKFAAFQSGCSCACGLSRLGTKWRRLRNTAACHQACRASDSCKRPRRILGGPNRQAEERSARCANRCLSGRGHGTRIARKYFCVLGRKMLTLLQCALGHSTRNAMNVSRKRWAAEPQGRGRRRLEV